MPFLLSLLHTVYILYATGFPILSFHLSLDQGILSFYRWGNAGLRCPCYYNYNMENLTTKVLLINLLFTDSKLTLSSLLARYLGLNPFKYLTPSFGYHAIPSVGLMVARCSPKFALNNYIPSRVVILYVSRLS